MTFTATVQNGNIKLPPGVHLPDGTQVIVVPPEEDSSISGRQQPLSESLRDFIGCLNTGLGDLAQNHDHYLYGGPKREK